MTLSFNLQQEPNIQVPEEQQFQLKWTEEQTKSIIESYKKRPGRLDEQQLKQIEEHAHYHNIPFYTGDFSLLDALGDIGKGFLSGFTTLDMFDTLTTNMRL